MKKTTIVAFLLLTSSKLLASGVDSQIDQLESEWAKIYYSENSEQHNRYPHLIKKATKISEEHPHAVEAVIWQAIIIATNAAYESPFKALSSIETAKELLEQSIKTQPEALEGAAFVVLATLYYMSPGWPISFGNQNRAELLFKEALKINPSSIDSNYFYADYLLSKDEVKDAQVYFKRAISAPVRHNQVYADTQLQEEARTALINSQQRTLDKGRNKFLSLFTSANAE